MDPRAQVMGMLCVLLVVVPITLWIGSFILRAAISLTNKILGGAPPSELDYYNIPSGHGRYHYEPTGRAIPMPSTGRAMGILLLIGVVDFVVRCGILIAAGAGSAIGARSGNGGMSAQMATLISLPVSLVLHTTMMSSVLPTSLGRAFLVWVFYFLIVVVISVLIGVALALLVVGKTRMH